MTVTERKWTLMGAPLGRVYVSAGPSIGGPDDDGIGAEVEVVPADQLAGAVDPAVIVAWLRGRTGAHAGAFTSADDVADAIEREFITGDRRTD